MPIKPIAVTAVGDFGANLAIQFLPYAAGEVTGYLEATDETGITLTKAVITRDLRSTRFITIELDVIFIPWVSVAYVTRKETN